MKVRYYASCFVVRPARAGASHEFLQLLRAPGRYMEGTWQLVTGGIEGNETAWEAAVRELFEETALVPLELYQVDVVNTFYLAAIDAIFHSPMFCAIVDPAAEPRLNHEHTDHRWIARDRIESHLMWPGERTALAELTREILDDGPAKRYLHVPL